MSDAVYIIFQHSLVTGYDVADLYENKYYTLDGVIERLRDILKGSPEYKDFQIIKKAPKDLESLFEINEDDALFASKWHLVKNYGEYFSVRKLDLS